MLFINDTLSPTVKIELKNRSVVEHSSADQKFPSSIPDLVLDHDETCFMHFTPGMVHNLPKTVGI